MTDIYMDQKKLRTLNIHIVWEGEFVWLEGITETGEKIQTMYMKAIA